MMEMFEIRFREYWFMLIVCGIINILSMMFILIQTMNAKAEELHEKRADELIQIKPDPKIEDEDEREYRVFDQKHQILTQINKSATFFGLWLSNLSYLGSFILLSFILFRSMSTSWNYYLSSFIAVILTQYMPFYFVREPSYNPE